MLPASSRGLIGVVCQWHLVRKCDEYDRASFYCGNTGKSRRSGWSQCRRNSIAFHFSLRLDLVWPRPPFQTAQKCFKITEVSRNNTKSYKKFSGSEFPTPLPQQKAMCTGRSAHRISGLTALKSHGRRRKLPYSPRAFASFGGICHSTTVTPH